VVVFWGVTICLSLGLGLLALELGLRAFWVPSITPGHVRTHPERRYELRPGFRGSTYGAAVEINSYGLRDLERPISRGDQSYRIGVFGDSITFGIGVEMEETFPKVLERRLTEFFAKPVQVFNLGVASYNTVSEYRYLKEVFDQFKFDLVIVEFTAGNDSALMDPPGSRGTENKWAAVRWAKDLLRQFYAYHWLGAKNYALRHALSRRSRGEELRARMLHDESLYQDDFQGWIDAKEAFRNIAAFSSERGVMSLFAVFANNIRLAPRLEEDVMYPIVAKVTRTLKAAGIRHVSVLDEAFRSYAGRERELWISPGDSHFSVLAHRLAGEYLFSHIVTNGLIETSRKARAVDELSTRR